MVNSLLILTSSSTGNNIFCTPAIRFLRKHLPQARIDVVALNALSAQVFEHNPAINKLWVTSSLRRVNKLAQDYDAVLAFNKNALKKLPFNDPRLQLATIDKTDVHYAEQLLAFCQQWLSQQLQRQIEITDEDRCYAIYSAPGQVSLLSRFDVQPADTVINIHLGCGTTLLHGWKFFYARRADDKKLWSIDAYIQLGQLLVQAIPGVRLVITGTSNEAFLAKKFVKAVPNSINLAGKTTVADLRQLMERSNLFISHDCGVFHVAAAAQVPMLGLFGPTNHLLTGPYPQRANRHLIKKDSMADIRPQEVLQQALLLLGRPAQA
ncbi:glycosyltransferase family 9 protein [Methylophilus sp. DW102]|uniref:glycosyltransferase family 9 protein n=1 Tax=Methylophilus sp. DW102 TaxID=3095607 RepID=UPI003089A4ED|nr:glycosyltransferase family 9 protein [Methylophilus sp. DW102]